MASNGADGQTANPIPFLLDANHGAYGRLRGHLSEPNERGDQNRPAADREGVVRGLGKERDDAASLEMAEIVREYSEHTSR
ncbi:MAG: hypothetical protein ACTHJQ_19880 [Rhizobiaceae bacterium]